MKEISFPKMAAITSPNPVTLICTKKEDGSTNFATISWWMPLSYNPNLFAAAINNNSLTGERIREMQEAVLTIPSVGAEADVMGCGSTSGRNNDKQGKFNIEMTAIEGTDIAIPVRSAAAVVGKLLRHEEAGDHTLYIFEVQSVFANEENIPLFAWKGYAEAAPAQKA